MSTATRSRRPASTRGTRRPSPSGARRWWPAVAVGAAAALVVVVAVGALRGGRDAPSGQADSPVERFLHVHGLAVAPWAPEDVYLSTHAGLVLIDSGGEWRWASQEPHDFMGFAVHPDEPGVMFSSGHPAPGSGLANPVGFMVSGDGGRTWLPRSLHGQADFHAMAVHSHGRVVFGWDVMRGGLLRSVDGGHTWEPQPAPALEEAGVISLAVHAVDADTVLAGARGGLWRSTDAGASWELLVEAAAVTGVAYDPSAPARVVAYVVAADGGLVESRDGGRTWTPLGLQLTDGVVTHIALHPSDRQRITVGSDDMGLYATRDGGATWVTLAADGVPVAAR